MKICFRCCNFISRLLAYYFRILNYLYKKQEKVKKARACSRLDIKSIRSKWTRVTLRWRLNTICRVYYYVTNFIFKYYQKTIATQSKVLISCLFYNIMQYSLKTLYLAVKYKVEMPGGILRATFIYIYSIWKIIS